MFASLHFGASRNTVDASHRNIGQALLEYFIERNISFLSLYNTIQPHAGRLRKIQFDN